MNFEMPIFDISFKVILPRCNGDFFSEWADCLQQFILLQERTRNRIIKLNIFLHSESFQDFKDKSLVIDEGISEYFGEICPISSILPNSPANSHHVAIEIDLINPGGVEIFYRKCEDLSYIVVEKSGCKKLFANNLGSVSGQFNTGVCARNAFEIMNKILRTESMTFDHIVRQWNYIGGILRTKNDGLTRIQSYQLFNEVRHEYYSKYRIIQGFPAATGIGMNYGGVIIDFIAVAPCQDMHLSSIFNPSQVNPCHYGQDVLIGDSASIRGHKNPPMFDRAKLMSFGDKAVIFISGTASIIGQETVGMNNIREQLRHTIENINALVDPVNIMKDCTCSKFADRLKFKRIRVYVKNRSDFEICKSVCRLKFGDIPAIYLQADICRDDLLVEIETQLRS